MANAIGIGSNTLEGIQKLNGITHLYNPKTTRSPNSTDPSLVILCAWAFAQIRHISKYLRGYQEQYPATQILLIQADTGNLLWRPDDWQMPMFEPAVLAIKEHLNAASRPGILLHTFSNGGSHTAIQLAQAYRQSFTSSSTEKTCELPINAIVFDSCPSPPRFQLGVKAVSMGLPKNAVAQTLGVAVVFAMLGFFAVLHETGISELFLAKACRQLNQPPFLKGTVPRTYIYSKMDTVIREEDVLQHAADARSSLKESSADNIVRAEEFVGSQHVNHVSIDPERYWRIIADTWNQAVKMS